MTLSSLWTEIGWLLMFNDRYKPSCWTSFVEHRAGLCLLSNFVLWLVQSCAPSLLTSSYRGHCIDPRLQDATISIKKCYLGIASIWRIRLSITILKAISTKSVELSVISESHPGSQGVGYIHYRHLAISVPVAGLISHHQMLVQWPFASHCSIAKILLSKVKKDKRFDLIPVIDASQ